jgi:hypothetical protein
MRLLILASQANSVAKFVSRMHWLSNCSKPSPLVINHADDSDIDVSKSFPTGPKGHILTTTRNLETQQLPLRTIPTNPRHQNAVEHIPIDHSQVK